MDSGVTPPCPSSDAKQSRPFFTHPRNLMVPHSRGERGQCLYQGKTIHPIKGTRIPLLWDPIQVKNVAIIIQFRKK